MRQEKGSCIGCVEFARMARALRDLSSLKTILWQGKSKRKERDLIRFIEHRALKGLGEGNG